MSQFSWHYPSLYLWSWHNYCTTKNNNCPYPFPLTPAPGFTLKAIQDDSKINDVCGSER